MSRKVWVELKYSKDERTINVIRIFKSRKAAILRLPFGAVIDEILKASAVCNIRRQVFKRDGYTCTHCGKSVTWDTGHMHERVWKGRGGEVSVENCVCLCAQCHLDDPVAGHGKRRLQFSSGVV